jgi:3-hydroxyisobutyrate dehydrogenase-like beta-hydroxyacid dehydrogenase
MGSSRVTVMGLGNMGSALAHSLLRHGHDVVVWNRTPERASSTVLAGADLAPSPEEAIKASPVSIMCLSDYAAATEVLARQGVREALANRTFVQLTSGVPDEVATQCEIVQGCGAMFLAGGIMVFPSGIGRADASIVYAGDVDAFDQHRNVLAGLGGSPKYLGADLNLAVSAFCTAGMFTLGSVGLFLETAMLARHFGISIDAYYGLVRMAADVALERIRDSADRISTGRYFGDEASIDMILGATRAFSDVFSGSGISARIADAFTAQLEHSSANGGGRQDIFYLAKSLWANRLFRTSPGAAEVNGI